MKKFAVVFLGVALAACSSSGNQVLKNANDSTVSQQITKGTSTKADVRKYYGDPTHTSFTDAGNEIWTYTYTKGQVKAENFIPIVSLFSNGVDVDKKELVILFDSNGVVKNYSMQISKEEVKGGIVPQ
jgi:outer membrane protein assembly factor BamE (lipoprotein component of BamABCDE complex)